VTPEDFEAIRTTRPATGETPYPGPGPSALNG
jgi:hypothetical protein